MTVVILVCLGLDWDHVVTILVIFVALKLCKLFLLLILKGRLVRMISWLWHPCDIWKYLCYICFVSAYGSFSIACWLLAMAIVVCISVFVYLQLVLSSSSILIYINVDVVDKCLINPVKINVKVGGRNSLGQGYTGGGKRPHDTPHSHRQDASKGLKKVTPSRSELLL
ncbi:hypothetical protein Tco_0246165 [Tanacetum coccineum]